MKSLAELTALREEMKNKMGIRSDGESTIRIVVGMATCGIAAGARPVLQCISEEVSKRNLNHVSVQQTGCIGMCMYEPMVEVYSNNEKTTYINVTTQMIPTIVTNHIVNGNPVMEYTVGVK